MEAAALPQQTEDPKSAVVLPATKEPGMYDEMPQRQENDNEQFVSKDAGEQIKPTSYEQFKTSLHQTSRSLPIGIPGLIHDEPGAFMRWWDERKATKDAERNSEVMLRPEDANKKYPGMPVPFNEPVYDKVAQLRYNNAQHLKELQEWKQKGGPSPWLDLSAGLVGGFADPVNLGLMAATGAASKVVQGIGAAGRAIQIARIGEAIEAGTMTVEAGEAAAQPLLRAAVEKPFISAGQVGKVYAENLAINEATGIPTYLQEKREGQDVTFLDAQKQAFEGALGGTLFHYAIKGAAVASKRGLEFFRRVPEAEQATILRSAVEAHEQGKKIDLDGLIKAAEDRASGRVGADVPTRYTFNEIAHPSEAPHFGSLNEHGQKVSFEPYGEGTYVTDNKFAANNSGEVVGKFDIPKETKFLDLETPAASAEAEPVIEAVAKALKMDEIKPQPSETIKGILDSVHDGIDSGQLSEGAIQDVQKAIKALGFDGYKYVAEHPNGDKTNGALLFDKNATPSQQFKSNPEMRLPDPSKIEVPEVRGELSMDSALADTKRDQELHEQKNKAPVNSKPDALDKVHEEEINALMEKMKSLVEDGHITEEDLKSLKEDQVKDARTLDTIKRFVLCGEGA